MHECPPDRLGPLCCTACVYRLPPACTAQRELSEARTRLASLESADSRRGGRAGKQAVSAPDPALLAELEAARAAQSSARGEATALRKKV
jgi:hypothetical protein